MITTKDNIDSILNGNMDVYEKINEKKDLSLLIIAESSINTYQRYDTNVAWQKEFEKVLNNYVESDYHIDTLLLRGSHVGWAYIQAMTDLNGKNYDLMILDVDEVSTLPLYYEVLLRTIIKQNPKIEIVLMNNEAFNLNVETLTPEKEQTRIEKINASYGVSSLIINQSDTSDIPEGNNALIANAIMESLLYNVHSNKEVSHSLPNIKEEELELLDAVTAIKGNVWPISVNGFLLKEGLLYNMVSNSSLEYQVIEPLVCLSYITFNEGGRFKVYMNDVLIDTVDSYSEATGVGVVLFPLTTEMKSIRIQTIDPSGSGRYIMLHNLLLGDF
jgi:hypothetical protein